MVKKTTSKTKEKLMEENSRLRSMLYEQYQKRKKGIYALQNGVLPMELLEPNIEKSFQEYCKEYGV